MFETLAAWVTRRSVMVLGFWVVLAAALWSIAPAWETVSRDDDVRFFPPGSLSVVGQHLLEKGFPESSATSEAVFISQRSESKLTEADRAFLDRLAQRLRSLKLADPTLKIKKITDYNEPVIGLRLIGGSGEPGTGQAALTIVSLAATHLSKRARLTVDRLMEELVQIRADAPEGLRVEITGSAVVGHDSNQAANESVKVTTWATLLLVVLILILVYRTPLFALLPVATIALSVLIGLKGIAALTLVPGLNFQVINVANVFVVVVLFGAGTDYCLFLIARYREELRRGLSHDQAIREALLQVGGALVASAGTVIVGLGMLYFSTFTKIQYTGPAIALSLAIALLAALTIAPVLLHWFRDAVFWPLTPPHRRPNPESANDSESEAAVEATHEGIWNWIADQVVRRPGIILGLSLAVLAPFAVIGSQTRSNFSQLGDLGSNQPSVRGSNLIRRYFPVGELGRTVVLLSNPQVDFRKEAERAAVADLCRRLESLEDVAEVRSLSQPLGKAPRNLLERLALQAIRIQSDPRYVGLAETVAEGNRGRITRIELVFRTNPFSEESFETLSSVSTVVDEATRTGLLRGSIVGYAGVTPQLLDLKRVINADERRMYVLVTLGVYLILWFLLRRPLICLYLIFTVVLGYLASLGVAELVFRWLHTGPDPWVGLDWKVGFFLFVILVAVGEDYNIFLMSRVIEEEKRHGPIEGTRRAVARTGGIISSCGLIMAGTFGSMLTGRLVTLKELGFALSLGVLLDTFVVRPILVPAFLVLWHRWNPGRVLESKISRRGEPRAHSAATQSVGDAQPR